MPLCSRELAVACKQHSRQPLGKRNVSGIIGRHGCAQFPNTTYEEGMLVPGELKVQKCDHSRLGTPGRNFARQS